MRKAFQNFLVFLQMHLSTIPLQTKMMLEDYLKLHILYFIYLS